MPLDGLSAESITANLNTRVIGRRVIYYPQVASTNDVARQEAQQGAAEGTVVIADEQTAGRGRIKRVWLSPRGNISLSIILRPSLSHLPYLIMVASLAVVRSIELVTGLKAQIKWPNDILINGKKVCGILIENEVRGSALAFAVIGIGINLKLSLADFPEVAAAATCLADELGKEVSRLEMIRSLLVEFERLYLMLSDRGEFIFREWQSRLITLGRKVRVISGDSVLAGIVESVATDGSLLLRLPDGGSTRIVAGDVNLREQN